MMSNGDTESASREPIFTQSFISILLSDLSLLSLWGTRSAPSSFACLSYTLLLQSSSYSVHLQVPLSFSESMMTYDTSVSKSDPGARRLNPGERAAGLRRYR